MPPIAGRDDYRAILHAHAEDSAHTGGTRAEMLAEAKRAGVHAILLTDHYRPPRDFITDSWRGLREGVLFIPGSEIRGFLIYPSRSIMARMDDPTPGFIEAVRDDGGLIFLSHVEERPDHSMAGLDGMEIYNRHADAKKDEGSLVAITLKLTDPASLAELEESLRLYPDELLGAQQSYPTDYLAKWDAETKSRRLTGVAANDCHHNMVLLVTMVDEDHVRVGIERRRRGEAADRRRDPPPRHPRHDQGPSTRRRAGTGRPRSLQPLVPQREHAHPRHGAERAGDPPGLARGACLREPRLDLRPDRVPLRAVDRARQSPA